MSIKRDPTIKAKINKEACYTCTPGASFELCRPFPSAPNDKQCADQCKDQYNATSYFYDKNGTKYCYCGKTKASCEQYDYLTSQDNACNDKSNKECVLVSGSIINEQAVPEVTNEATCISTCNKILKSDGLYCDNKCICTDPSIGPVPKDVIADLTKEYGIKCATDGVYSCPDGTPIQSGAGPPLPDNYFGFGNFLGKGINDNVLNSFCGCDKSIIAFYNAAFPGTTKPTLGGIWKTALESIKSKDPGEQRSELYSAFNRALLDVAHQANDSTKTKLDINKLKALSAYEMCRATNNQYSRKKPTITPSINKDPEGWLKSHLDADKTNSGKYLNRGVKILVMAMLLHVLFRTVIPKRGNLRDSLVYAMFMPQQFMQGRPQEKAMVMGGAITLMLAMMSIIYTMPRLTAGNTGILYGSLGIFSILTVVGVLMGSAYFPWFALGIPLTVISAIVVAAEHPKDKPLLSTKAGIISGILGLILLLMIGIGGIVTNRNYLKLAFVLMPILVSVLLILHIKPGGYDEGEAFLRYFLPESFKKIPTSGFAISIYAVAIGAILTRLNILGGFGLAWIIVGFWIFAIASIMIYSAVMEENLEGNLWNHYSKILYIILGSFLGISVVSGIIGGAARGSAFFIPFVISTIFGALPLATFTIIINFAIANYSPAIELLFLVLYRISGFLTASNPNSGIGNIILAIFGKRSTDKWVMPFLPLVSHIVRAYYKISGDNLPGYFTTTNAATGVTNSDMWMS